jgi:hypothetical protein
LRSSMIESRRYFNTTDLCAPQISRPTRPLRSGALPVLLALTAIMVSTALAADANVTSTQVLRKKLLPIVPPRNAFYYPAFKFFEDDKLVGIVSGALKPDIPLTSALHTLPDGFGKKTMNAELADLNLSAPTQGKTLVIYVGEICPPCDQIVGDIKSRLPGAGWAQAKILTVRIAME